MLEEQPFLASRAFEDEIVRMIVAYLGAVTEAADPDPDPDPDPDRTRA